MRWLLLGVLMALVPTFATSAIVASTPIGLYEKAPVLVTGRVTSVEYGPLRRVPSASTGHDVMESTAVVEVLRARSLSEDLLAPVPFQSIRIRFYAIPRQGGGVNGPSLPTIEQGSVFIFPLRSHEDVWRLSADSGSQPTLRATAEPLKQPADIEDNRDYLLTEIAGVLAHGTATEVADIARGLHSFLRPTAAEATTEILAQLDTAVGDDVRRWASIAVLYSFGQPMFLPNATGDVVIPEPRIVERATQRLSQFPQSDLLLTTALLENMPLFPGRRGPVLDLAGEPAFIGGLREGLSEDVAGAMALAYALAQSGFGALLPEARARALRVADRAESHSNDVIAAGRLSLEFGNEAHLRAYAAFVRKYRVADPSFYNSLWQSATVPDNRNSAYVLAVVLEDRRVAFRNIRTCDLAVGSLERATGEDFGSDPEGPIAARNQAVDRAFAWLRAEGIVDGR
jgi:hypothetical protein